MGFFIETMNEVEAIMEQNNNHDKERIRVVTFLCRKQIDYLDRMGKDALFLKGKKLSRTQILASLVDMLIRANISMKELDLDDGNLPEQLLNVIEKKAEDEKKDA